VTDIDLPSAIAHCAAAIEDVLAARLENSGAPERLLASMRHGTLDGGKRLRPFLVQETAALFGIAPEASHAAGAAIEMVHCYSLIHDDLPDMDNDELRRGRPTVWKAFDPALAILAGDALLTDAFGLLTSPSTHPDPATRAELVVILARAAGPSGMVGGQVLDIEGETTPLDEDGILEMQAKKTGALICASAEMGAVLGNAAAQDRAALARYGAAAGRAFQLADDILDITASSATLGKTAGKDVAQSKSTIVARRGLQGAREILDRTVNDGINALQRFGPEADRLRALIQHFAEREH